MDLLFDHQNGRRRGRPALLIGAGRLLAGRACNCAHPTATARAVTIATMTANIAMVKTGMGTFFQFAMTLSEAWRCALT